MTRLNCGTKFIYAVASLMVTSVTLSSNRIGQCVAALGDNSLHNIEVFNHETTTRTSFIDILSRQLGSSRCIRDEKALRQAMKSASSDSSKPATIITVCSRIPISNTKDPTTGETGIDLSNKFIDLRCNNTRGPRCVLDGKKKSRIFFGSTTSLNVTRFDFINAYNAMGYGTTLIFDADSKITLSQCSFRNNWNELGGGGAISVLNSELTIMASSKSPSVFLNNKAETSGALRLENTVFRALSGNVKFINNTSSFLPGAIAAFDSDVSMNGVHFLGNRAFEIGAMWSSGGTLSLKNTVFADHKVPEFYSGLSIDNCNASLDGVSFHENSSVKLGSLTISMSNVTLTNCTLWDNKVQQGGGADLYIEDDEDPSKGGSFVSCTNTVFCDGTTKQRIFDGPKFKNTNCREKGIVRECSA